MQLHMSNYCKKNSSTSNSKSISTQNVCARNRLVCTLEIFNFVMISKYGWIDRVEDRFAIGQNDKKRKGREKKGEILQNHN